MLRLFLLFLALNFIFDIQAQKDIEQKKRADNYFQNQQYSTAINEYRQLLAQNQKNMEINFKYATCLFYTEDIKQSMRYFDLVLNQSEVPVDAYFYRAKIYQHQYNFTKAIQLFTKYLELKPKKEQNLDAQTEINFCKQAKSAIGQLSSLKILARSISPGIDFYNHYVFTSKNYSYYSAEGVFEKQNSKNNFKPIYAFLRGMRYRIFASYNDNSESGKDLFIQKKDEKGEWGKPIRLCQEINSTFDEDFPFFDEVDGYLYFSSRGHGSIGGYDLFKVKYNLNENTCSELVNLGFPYSSPNDDYFFIPDYGTPNALFATNRNGNTAKIEIVKVEKEQKKVEMLFVKGVFSDLIDSQNKDLEITVKHKETGETFGPIYSSKEGKYLIYLPKDGVYTFQSKVTGSLTVFTKDVEITNPPKGKQFSQEIKYEMIDSKEELTIISKITNEVSDDEMDLLMFTQIGKLEVNAQTLQQQGITASINSQENNVEVKTDVKENPLIEQLLDKEIDIENQLKNQIIVKQLIQQSEAKIESQQKEIEDLRLAQSQNIDIEERKNSLEIIKSNEEALIRIIKETVVLNELELSEREVVESRNNLAKLTELNKNLAEEQLKGENQKVNELITTNQTFITAISTKNNPPIEERISSKSTLIATSKTDSENEIKEYQTQEQNLSKEIEGLRLSKEGKTKKQIEEIDLVIAQKEKNLKTIRQVKVDALFMLEELTLKELAFIEVSGLKSEIESKSSKVSTDELQRLSPIYVEKFNISTMADLIKENKKLTKEETRKVEDLQKFASTSAQIADTELTKILEKYNSDISQIDTNLPAAEIIDLKISNEQNLSANLSDLLKKVTNEVQKEKLNELIQLSTKRLETLTQEKETLIKASNEVKPNLTNTPITVNELAKIQEKYTSDLSKIEEDLPALEKVDLKISKEQNLQASLSDLLKKETNEDQKEKINELIQLSTTRMETLTQEKETLIKASNEVKPNLTNTPITVNELAKIQEKYTSDLSKIEEDLPALEKVDLKISKEQNLQASLSDLLKKETNEDQKEKINELIQLSSARMESLIQEKEKLIKASNEVKPIQTVPEVNVENQEIAQESQKQIEVLNSLQRQNEARSESLNQALKTKKEELLKTTNQAEIVRLDKEVRSLESQIQAQNNQAIANEKNSAIKKEFPTFEVLTESEIKAKIASLNIEKDQIKQSLKATNSTQDNKVLEQQISGIDSSIEVLESLKISEKKVEQSIVLAETEVLDNDELTKKAASPNYANYIVKRNEITQLDNEITTLKSETNSIRKTLNQEINKDSQVEISPKQRELLTKITENEQKISEKLTLRNQKTLAQAQTPEAANYEWMLNNSIEATVPTQSSTVISTNSSIETSFKIIDKQAVDVSIPLPVNIKNPRGLVYRVQVGAFRKPVPNEFFREFSPVSGDILQNGLTCYMAGYFNNINTASTAKNEIRTIGYKDAFIVAYCDGKRISYAEAKALEASGACVPLSDNELKIAVLESLPTPTINEPNTVSAQNQQGEVKPIVDVTYNQAPGAVEAVAVESLEALFFTVQVGVYNKPIKQEQLPGFIELFTSKSAKGQIRYSSGKFQSLDDAKTRRKEAVEKGVADAFIVAYYQGKRIAIAEANQLVERFGASVFEEKLKMETSPSSTNNSSTTNSVLFEPIVILQKKEVEEKVFKYEQIVDEESIRALLEQLNQNGIFTYNPQTSKVSSNHLTENQYTSSLMNAVVDMNEVIVAKGKVKPITFVLKSSNWSGSFGNWILHCPYEFKPLNNKEIQFFPRTIEEVEELKQLAKELIISIYE